jgi:FkbM family methyltransferase
MTVLEIIRRKLRTAASVLETDGLAALVRRTAKRYLAARGRRPDESAIVFALFKNRQQGGTMIDVGAHFGSSLAPFARSGWQIVAFEPDDDNRKALEKSFGSLANVHIDPRGLSDEPRNDVPFFTSEVSTGISGLSAFHPSHVASGRIDVTTLDRVCANRNLQSLDFLKIDTEGFDLFVLKGFPWRRFKPRVILCEFEDAKTVPLGYSFHDLAGYLQDKGYALVVSEWCPIKEYGGVHDWRRFSRYPGQLKDAKGWGNIIAVDSEDLFRELLRLCARYGPIGDTPEDETRPPLRRDC